VQLVATGSELRGSWETSPWGGGAGLVLSLVLLWATGIATSWCHTVSNAFSKRVSFLPHRVRFCLEREDGKAEP